MAPEKVTFNDRGPAIVGSLIPVIILGTAFVVWRLIVSWKAKGKFTLSDYLIMLSAILNIVANAFSIKSAYEGQGRHITDPSILPTLIACFKDIYIAQVTNVFAMAFLKMSISAYLITLNFSPTYRGIIWLSLFLVVTCNFILPSIVLFGNCRPLSLRWNRKQPGSCWPKKVNAASGYTQSGANIITDIIYSASPLVYLASVQLAKSTQWGLRAVFLLGLLGTACSIAKLFKLNSLQSATDTTYQSVDLTIWSSAEVGMGLIVSCLPPLRKTFDNFLHRIVPNLSSGTRVTRANNFNLKSYEITKPTSVVHNFGTKDNDSEWAILPDEAGDIAGGKGKKGILRTTNVEIVDESSHGSQSGASASRDSFQRGEWRGQGGGR
ncbi:hypothetical protein BU16DRAFT_511637 [Lophium mytilinum]|uniref:Rhodopsin domain-containing protein n=1 Tax=Lophium mytilinum TaxID=390894 RepID=A0A6A6QRH5_9PEZI|nr:hypothetical protein BU16DRAFT_511637 [Lophium mytilinum]